MRVGGGGVCVRVDFRHAQVSRSRRRGICQERGGTTLGLLYQVTMVNSRLRLVRKPTDRRASAGKRRRRRGIESGKGEGGGWKPPSLPPFAHTLLVR